MGYAHFTLFPVSYTELKDFVAEKFPGSAELAWDEANALGSAVFIAEYPNGWTSIGSVDENKYDEIRDLVMGRYPRLAIDFEYHSVTDALRISVYENDSLKRIVGLCSSDGTIMDNEGEPYPFEYENGKLILDDDSELPSIYDYAELFSQHLMGVSHRALFYWEGCDSLANGYFSTQPFDRAELKDKMLKPKPIVSPPSIKVSNPMQFDKPKPWWKRILG